MGEFGLSQPVRRLEDPKLLRGEGQFIGDLSLEAENCDALWGACVRSPHAHAAIEAIDCSRARELDGVLAVLTAADLGELGAIACAQPPPGMRFAAGAEDGFVERRQPALASDRVRFAGECVAFVVATDAAIARDATELVEVEYRALDAVTECDSALEEAAPNVWDDLGDNLSFRWEMGDETPVRRAIADAHRVVHLKVVNNRVSLAPLETRGAIGRFDGGRYILDTPTQMPHGIRDQLAKEIFSLDPALVQVRVGDVGGSFGGKNSLYPEQILVLVAASMLGRPVAWLGDRNESFLADFYGRDNVTEGTLALDENARVMGVDIHTFANLGAYTATRGTTSPTVGVLMTSNTYRIEHLHVRVDASFTHTVPTDPYRGAGRPEVLYFIERLMDKAAHELGIDPAEFRKRNLIPLAQFPYASPTGLNYDPCDFESIMDRALELSDWKHRHQRKANASARGVLHGIGIANYIERCGGGAGLSERADLALEPDGQATLRIGSMTNGQGHRTAYAQLINHLLDIPIENVQLVQGDTDRVVSGTGTGGSWSIPMGGGALKLAADRVIETATVHAADRLEAHARDVEFADGAFSVIGTDLKVSLDEVVRHASAKGCETAAGRPGLEETGVFQPENYTFPYGCHICELEVDPETGAVTVLRYLAVHDFGTALNPLLLAGQVHGGLAQGIGQALHESVRFDETGQLLTATFMDYAIPRADDLPNFEFEHWQSPALSNPFDIKGCGEAGAAGSPPAVINALLDALAPFDVDRIDMPATPHRVWQAINAARVRS